MSFSTDSRFAEAKFDEARVSLVELRVVKGVEFDEGPFDWTAPKIMDVNCLQSAILCDKA